MDTVQPPTVVEIGGKLLRLAQRTITGKATLQERLVVDHEELLELSKILRGMGCVIVFTEGTFDLAHIGHTRYLQKGKEEAARQYPEAEHTILVVGVDTDELVRARKIDKGPNRPIVGQDERMEMVASLRCVDIVTPLHAAEVLNRRLRPEVRVISTSTGDNPNLDALKRDCGVLIELRPQAQTSTSARIRRLMIDGRMETVGKITAQLATLIQGIQEEPTDE